MPRLAVLAAAMFVHSAASPLRAQESTLEGSYFSGGVVEPTPLDAPAAVPYAGYGGDDYAIYDEYLGPVNKPVNWLGGPYIKAGPVGIIGEGILDDPDVGWTVSGGYRQPLGPELGGNRLFFDLGGSYLSAYGETTQLRDAQRLTFNPITQQVTLAETLPNSTLTTLDEIKRGAVDFALGWYWGDPIDRPGNDPQWRVSTRIGGRVGHIHAEIEEEVLVAPGANQTVSPIFNYGHTDTFGGLLIGTEVLVLQRDNALGNVQWIIDAEFANDWIELDNFESSSLGTASVMFGFMLTR